MAEVVRITTDVTCPACQYPEIIRLIDTDNMETAAYVCSSSGCNWANKERPTEE